MGCHKKDCAIVQNFLSPQETIESLSNRHTDSDNDFIAVLTVPMAEHHHHTVFVLVSQEQEIKENLMQK